MKFLKSLFLKLKARKTLRTYQQPLAVTLITLLLINLAVLLIGSALAMAIDYKYYGNSFFENISSILHLNPFLLNKIVFQENLFLSKDIANVLSAIHFQKEIHKPFPYIEKLEVMKVAMLREMATRAFYESKYLWNKCEGCSQPEVKSNIFRAKKRERQYHLFVRKAAKLEKELKND